MVKKFRFLCFKVMDKCSEQILEGSITDGFTMFCVQPIRRVIANQDAIISVFNQSEGTARNSGIASGQK